jgi:hypothetical protein
MVDVKNIKITIDKFNDIWYDGRRLGKEIGVRLEFLYINSRTDKTGSKKQSRRNP